MIQFEVGKHYDGTICLARRGKKEIWVYMPFHREGQPIPEYWPRGKRGIYADWYRVRVEDGVECAGPAWLQLRADNWMTEQERAAEPSPVGDNGKRKSKKQIEREEFENSCRVAREFYAGILRAVWRGVCFVCRKYAELVRWMFSSGGYSKRNRLKADRDPAR